MFAPTKFAVKIVSRKRRAHSSHGIALHDNVIVRAYFASARPAINSTFRISTFESTSYYAARSASQLRLSFCSADRTFECGFTAAVVLPVKKREDVEEPEDGPVREAVDGRGEEEVIPGAVHGEDGASALRPCSTPSCC